MRPFSPLLIIAILTTTPVLAETYVVNPAGTGDFPTIQAAVGAAIAGDVIELTDGTFAGDGNRDVNYLGKAITIRSQSGQPEQCIVNVAGTEIEPHRGFSFVSGEQSTSLLEGITITGGWVESPERGAGVRCDSASSPRIDSCIFTGNQGRALSIEHSQSLEITSCHFIQNQALAGAGISCRSSSMTVDDCHFAENEVDWSGAGIYGSYATVEITNSTFTENWGRYAGAMAFHENCDVTISDCLIADNSSLSSSGITLFLAVTSTIERCTFVRNTATGGSTLFTDKISDTTLRNCTFWGNSSPGGTLLCGHLRVMLENCVIAADTDGPGVVSHFEYTDLFCCDIHGNAGGDWVGNIADQYGVNGNISQDPLFCDPANGDFRLDATSPCAPFSPPNTACDLIGAWEVGCGSTAVEPATWGQVKAVFRR